MSALKKESRWWRPRSAPAAGRYAPRLVNVRWVLPLAVLFAGVAFWLLYLLLRHWAGSKESVLDVVRAAIGVAAFFGAVLAGVYAYRKQRLAEGDARQSDAEQLAGRYATAAEQLGHEKAAVRLAGVYAMARLADDWPEERQTCIDVLCAYLRMPYSPDHESPKHKEGEREVRHTIIRVIRDHLQDTTAATTWCGRNLDFTGAVFDGGGNVADGTIHDRVWVQDTRLARVRAVARLAVGSVGAAGGSATAARRRLLGHPSALVGPRRRAVDRARRNAAVSWPRPRRTSVSARLDDRDIRVGRRGGCGRSASCMTTVCSSFKFSS